MNNLISAIYIISIAIKIIVLARFEVADLGNSRTIVALICLPAVVSAIDKRLCAGLTEQYHGVDLLIQLMIIGKVFVKLYYCKDHYFDRLTRFIKLVSQCCPSFN
jgi:hypothetical protein